MTKTQRRQLSDTRSIERAFWDGLRPSIVCPRCGGEVVWRDLAYQCDACVMRWTRACPAS